MILQDKVVVITGVGPGMGRAMARIAAREGAKVAMGARNQAFLDAVADEIRQAGGEAIAVRTDVSRRADCDALVEATVGAFGRIDGLVNSAFAPGANGSFETADVEEWGKVFDVGCLGAVRMSQAVAPHMKAAGGGSIVNVATLQALKHSPGASLSYAVAKGAMATASRQLAAELAPCKIRVNTTRMGWLWGEPVRNALEHMAAHSGATVAELVEQVASTIPLGVIPPEEECGRTVLMFLSDYTTMVTGAVLDVNGGAWMTP